MKVTALKIDRKIKPQNLLNPEFKYVPAAATDITQTWKKHGWKPVEKKEKHYEK